MGMIERGLHFVQCRNFASLTWNHRLGKVRSVERVNAENDFRRRAVRDLKHLVSHCVTEVEALPVYSSHYLLSRMSGMS